MRTKKNLLIVLAVVTVMMTGCEEDERLARVVTETTRQQSEQNRSVAELTREATANHQRVVEATERSREELLSIQSDLLQQRRDLEDERRAIAGKRYRDSVLAPILQTSGMLLVAALPLVLCWMLLRGLSSEAGSADDTLNDVLINELLTENPRLLSSAERERLPQFSNDDIDDDDSLTPPF